MPRAASASALLPAGWPDPAGAAATCAARGPRPLRPGARHAHVLQAGRGRPRPGARRSAKAVATPRATVPVSVRTAHLPRIAAEGCCSRSFRASCLHALLAVVRSPLAFIRLVPPIPRRPRCGPGAMLSDSRMAAAGSGKRSRRTARANNAAPSVRIPFARMRSCQRHTISHGPKSLSRWRQALTISRNRPSTWCSPGTAAPPSPIGSLGSRRASARYGSRCSAVHVARPSRKGQSRQCSADQPGSQPASGCPSLPSR